MDRDGRVRISHRRGKLRRRMAMEAIDGVFPVGCNGEGDADEERKRTANS
jgi:hypothetical protein